LHPVQRPVAKTGVEPIAWWSSSVEGIPTLHGDDRYQLFESDEIRPGTWLAASATTSSVKRSLPNEEESMIRRTVLTSAIAAFGLSFLGQAAWAADPTIAGTWELNVAASKTTNPMPQSGTRTYTVDGNTEKMSATVVTADGKTLQESFTAAIDGKEHPYQSGTMGALMIVITKKDALTSDFSLKKDGKDVTTGSRTIAPDGKTMTIAAKGTNAEGKPYESSMVYDRK